MPAYDFKCESCGNTFEQRVPFGEDDKNLKCPYCNDANCRKIIGIAPVIFKGDGFTKSNGG